MKAVLITSGVLILVLTALRYLLRGRISLRLQYALWLLVAVRLLVPFSLPGTGFSVLNALSHGVRLLSRHHHLRPGPGDRHPGRRPGDGYLL